MNLLLSKLGSNHVWLAQELDYKAFLSVVKQCLMDIYMQDLSSSINESSQAIFYKHIFDFSFSNYLTVTNIITFEIIIA